jgi:hypothetical protein
MNYSNKTVDELKKICRERKIQGISGKKKQELIDMIKQLDAVTVSIPRKTQDKMSENVKMTITEVKNASPRTNVEPVIPLDKGGSYWYQKNKTDIPEYVKILEIHKDGNDYYYYTIQMRDKSEKQTIGQYLFNWKKPPLYSLLPDENRERIRRAYDYGFIQGELLHHTKAITKDDTREWRFEDIVPKNEEDRKRLNCVYNHAWNEAKRDEWKKQDKFLELFKTPFKL